jgi:hypothetical protein
MSFQNIKKVLALFSLCICLSISTRANACDFRAYEVPARESRTYRNANAGFSFSIPSNYRVMGRKNGIVILNPSTYSYIQCIIQNNIGTEFPQESFSVSITPIRASNSSLRDLVIQEMPWFKYEGFGFHSVSFLGKPALVFFQRNLLHDTTIKYTAFWSRDRRYLIIISGTENNQELRQALSTFQFE